MSNGRLEERRETPLEQRISTIASGLLVVGIVWLISAVVGMQSDLRTFSTLYALKQDLAQESEKRRTLEFEVDKLKSSLSELKDLIRSFPDFGRKR